MVAGKFYSNFRFQEQSADNSPLYIPGLIKLILSMVIINQHLACFAAKYLKIRFQKQPNVVVCVTTCGGPCGYRKIFHSDTVAFMKNI